MGSCKQVLTDVDMCDFKETKSEVIDVHTFIKYYRKRLKKSQIDLLNLMAENIYGFHLDNEIIYEQEDRVKTLLYGKHTHVAEFKFEHEGAEGKIIIRF